MNYYILLLSKKINVYGEEGVHLKITSLVHRKIPQNRASALEPRQVVGHHAPLFKNSGF